MDIKLNVAAPFKYLTSGFWPFYGFLLNRSCQAGPVGCQHNPLPKIFNTLQIPLVGPHLFHQPITLVQIADELFRVWVQPWGYWSPLQGPFSLKLDYVFLWRIFWSFTFHFEVDGYWAALMGAHIPGLGLKPFFCWYFLSVFLLCQCFKCCWVCFWWYQVQPVVVISFPIAKRRAISWKLEEFDGYVDGNSIWFNFKV